MARHTGPKNKLSRRENTDLFEKGTKMRRLNVPPGVHGPKSSMRKQSEYGSQLRAKQKVKRFYGILEKQFRKYYQTASQQIGSTGEILLQLLEQRLDNTLVRSGIVPTRAMARQLVVHNHVKINDQVVNRPSYNVEKNDVITLSSKAQNMPTIVKNLENPKFDPSPWISTKATIIKISSLPKRNDIQEEFNEQAIVEYYSR